MVLGEGFPWNQGGGEGGWEMRAGRQGTPGSHRTLQLSVASASLSGRKRRNPGTGALFLTGGLGNFT